MYKLILYLLVFILIDSVLADVVINELMYNPAGDEYDFEYIELHGEGEDISGWYFEGIDFAFPANTSISNYLVIANTLNDSGPGNDFLDRYPDVNCSFEYTGALSNTGETVILRDNNGNIIDLVTYDGSVNENHSLERIDINGNSNNPNNWAESASGGTPGRENSVSFISGCDWMLSVIINNTVSDDPEWQIRASKLEGDGKANITIKHWVEDHNGNTAKTYSDISIENALSQSTSGKYSPSLNKGYGYFIKANITNISCNDKDNSNNFVYELIFVPGEQGSYSLNSSINILEVSPDSAEFGDIIDVEINVYRGDTLKYAVYAYVEDDHGKKVSEENTMHFKNKFTNYTLTIPIQLDLNYDEDYEDDDYVIIVEGLDTEDTTEISLDGKSSECRTTTSASSGSSGSSSTKGFNYNLEEKPNNIEAGEEFEIKINIENKDKEGHEFDIWSYVYRGSKSYTGNRQDNLKTVYLPAQTSKIIALKNLMEEAEPGDYNLKIKIKRDDYKTEKEITTTIKVIEKEPEETEEQDSDADEENTYQETRPFIPNQNPLVLYESTSYKAKRLIPFLIIGLLALFSIILVWRR
jgi:hypothetical protein